MTVWEIVWQAGIIGGAIALALEPAYQASRVFAKDHGIDDRVYFAIAISLVHTVMYVTNNFFWQFLDSYGYLQQYKLERKPYMIAKPTLVRKMAIEATIGQLITGPITAYFLYPVFLWFGMPTLDTPLPPFLTIVKQLCLGHLFNDVGFYFTHRLFHTKQLYKMFHKQHHEFAGTIGFAAEYANPVETIVSNQIPTVGGMLFFGAHPMLLLLWIALRLQQTYEAHSGYCFDGTWLDKLGISHGESAAHHDHHHTVNAGNFGGMYTDWLFGTMDNFVSMGGKRGYIDMKKGKGFVKKKE
jgi:methylsterol monooxygenase